MMRIDLRTVADEGVSHNAKVRKRKILESGAIEGLIYYSRAIFPPGEIADAHRHDDMSEVFTIESGHGEIMINEAVYALEEGVTVVVEPGEVHEIRNTGDKELVVAYFGVSSAKASSITI